LNDNFLAYFVGALVFLEEGDTKGADGELPRSPRAAEGMDFVETATRLNVVGDDVVNALGARAATEETCRDTQWQKNL
jgi:hypothetical protein